MVSATFPAPSEKKKKSSGSFPCGNVSLLEEKPTSHCRPGSRRCHPRCGVQGRWSSSGGTCPSATSDTNPCQQGSAS